VKNNLPSLSSVRALRASLAFSLTIPFVAAACASGAAGEAVRPQAPSAASAMQAETSDALIACKPSSYAEPLIVDLSASARVDFEAAMDSGVALVNYDCKAVRLLKDCRLPGDYKFAGVSRKEEVIHLDNRDEIKANLPISASIKAGGELERASALDIAYVLVGKRTTPAKVSRGVLEGSQCGEATHYIRAATVGAFAIQTSTKGRVAAAAEVFGASTSGQSGSEKQSAKKDGDPRSCEQSRAGSDAPPGECRSAIRFELVPIGDKEAAPAGKDGGKDGGKDAKGKGGKGGKDESAPSIEDPCPDGFQLVGGKCAKKTDETRVAHLCAPKDVADCEAQCSAGHAGSCFNLGNLANRDYGKNASNAETRKNEERAMELWKKACDGGVFEGCYEYGSNRLEKFNSLPADPKLGVEQLNKACEGGSGRACYERADHKFEGNYGETRNAIEAFGLLSRSCKLGVAFACRDMGEYLFSGKQGIPRDPRLADRLMSSFCKQGDDRACYELGQHLLGLYEDIDKPEKPVSEISDAKARGRALLGKACEQGRSGSCETLGRILVEDNDPKGRPLLQQSCEAHPSDNCMHLGRALINGKGGPANKAQGVEWMLKSKDDAARLEAAQMLKKGDGVKKDPNRAREIMTMLCEKEEFKPACEALGKKPAKK